MMGAPYRSKKDLKASIGSKLDYIETSMFGPEFKPDGVNYVVGPDPYRNRKWYAAVETKGGIIVKVK